MELARRIRKRKSSLNTAYAGWLPLNYQVHDRAQPHHFGRHGKADLGWT